jgi:transcriptional regulator with XRE-family HTH domain
LEILALFLELPIDHFWGKEALSDDESPTKPFDLARLVQLRQRIIGAQLRQERLKANISMKALAETAGIPQSRLRAYEMGERPVPVPELEILLSELGGSMENFFDQSGPVGQWMANQRALREFSNLPPELQEFVCQPINRPYLELARNLSEMSAEKLRSVAEGLLNITY